MFIDSHAHLAMTIREKGVPVSDIIDEMIKNNVSAVVDICGTVDEFEFSLSLEALFRSSGIKLFHAAGIHPHESAQFIDSDISWIAGNSDSIIAIGEVGLDFHYDFSPRDIQEKTLRKMIGISIETQKPLIIHGRNAEDRIMDIIEEYDMNTINVLFHCYTGSLMTAQRMLKKGYFISFSGILTFKKNSGVSEVFDSSDKNRLFFETDSPFLSPVPFRGVVNTPGKVKYVYEKAAITLNEEIVPFSAKIKDNFNIFFNVTI